MKVVTLTTLKKFREKLKNDSKDFMPIGSIIPYTGNTIPDNYLLCDGSEISRSQYSGLFDVIGTSFGEGDGSTTFNLPKLDGKTLIGKDSTDTDFDAIGKEYGEKEHVLTLDEMPSHKHLVKYANYTAASLPSGTNTEYTNIRNTLAEKSTENAGGSQAHNNIQPSLVVNYIIKAFNSSGLLAQVINTKSTSNTDTYSCNYINDNIIDKYSFDEVKTNKTWIDGKPIYRKVFEYTNLPAGGTTREIETGITNIGIVTNMEGIGDFNGYFRPISRVSYNNTNEQVSYWYVKSSNKLMIHAGDNTGANYCYTKLYIIMKYTKID